MLCSAQDCGREAMYITACLCQKHYFRLRRNGTTETVQKAKPRIEDERGYQFLHAPDHPLVTPGIRYVAEHRVVLFAAIGPGPMACALCGDALTWKSCHVDHIDENPRNNILSNLRPTCRRCNVWRSMPPAAQRLPNAVVLAFEGVVKTAAEWARDPRVQVSRGAIAFRKRAGMTDAQALFAPKITHNGKGRNAARQAKKEGA